MLDVIHCKRKGVVPPFRLLNVYVLHTVHFPTRQIKQATWRRLWSVLQKIWNMIDSQKNSVLIRLRALIPINYSQWNSLLQLSFMWVLWNNIQKDFFENVHSMARTKVTDTECVPVVQQPASMAVEQKIKLPGNPCLDTGYQNKLHVFHTVLGSMRPSQAIATLECWQSVQDGHAGSQRKSNCRSISKAYSVGHSKRLNQRKREVSKPSSISQVRPLLECCVKFWKIDLQEGTFSGSLIRIVCSSEGLICGFSAYIWRNCVVLEAISGELCIMIKHVGFFQTVHCICPEKTGQICLANYSVQTQVLTSVIRRIQNIPWSADLHLADRTSLGELPYPTNDFLINPCACFLKWLWPGLGAQH